MSMVKYIFQRILLMLFVFAVIMVLCFLLIKAIPVEIPEGDAGDIKRNRYIAMHYLQEDGETPVNVWTQLGYKVKAIFTEWDWGESEHYGWDEVTDVVKERITPTIIVNVYSLLIAIPIGILFGIFAALKKNKWQDHVISTGVMLFISVPSFVYALLVQYILFFKLHLFVKPVVASLNDAGGSWFSWTMTKSFIMPVLSLAFGTIASLTRNTRAELTEALTSDYMLLARTKGLTRAQSIWRHALKNAMVPILPGIISSFVGILGGSFIIEQIFSIPGVGALYINSITFYDYDLFIYVTAFYTFIGLASNIVIDLSYGFLDPRVRMGSKK